DCDAIPSANGADKMRDFSASPQQGSTGGESTRSAGVAAAAHERVLRRRRRDRPALPAAGGNQGALWGDDRLRDTWRKGRGTARYGDITRSRFDETGARRNQRFAATHSI